MAIDRPETPHSPIMRRLKPLLGDVAFLFVFGVFWAVEVGPIVVSEQRRGGDLFRDVASVVNIQHGLLLADPGYRGESLWYPPGSPLIIAGVSSLTGMTPTDCYRWSQLLFNWMIPAGLFLVVRLWWGRWAAILGTVAMLLAMPWWQAEVAQGQPSIHAIVWGWIALLLYGWQHQHRSSLRALICGIFLGLSFWHHPFVPAWLAVSFVLQTIWAILRSFLRPAERSAIAGLILRNVLIVGVALLIAGPILYQMMHGPILNTVPREYLAAEFRTVRFALMHGNPWLWATGLIGLITCIRRADFGSRLLVSCLVVALFGQLSGYARLYGHGWAGHLPMVVPHEFQRLFQLAWAIVIGIGIDVMLRALTSRIRLFHGRPLAVGALILSACVLTGAWGLPYVKDNMREYMHVYSLPPQFHRASQWILQNTDINDVFVCEPTVAFIWLNAETGRKVWLLPRGHSNPRIDWEQRARVLAILKAASCPESFWRLARNHGIRYVVPSKNWMPKILADPHLQRVALGTYLKLVYGGGGELTILQIVDKPTGLITVIPQMASRLRS